MMEHSRHARKAFERALPGIRSTSGMLLIVMVVVGAKRTSTVTWIFSRQFLLRPHLRRSFLLVGSSSSSMSNVSQQLVSGVCSP